MDIMSETGQTETGQTENGYHTVGAASTRCQNTAGSGQSLT